MLVDDEPVVSEVVRMYLEDQGYEHFIITEDSTTAVALAGERRPDVVLLDLMMPEVDGFEVLERLRASPDTRHLPVIVLTSASDSDSRLRALELGATDFLAKPVDPSELVLRVRNILSMKAYQDRLALFDRVTDLPNRRWFIDRLARAVGDSAAEGTPCAVLQFGIDRFKQVNDAMGYVVGDKVLGEFGARIRDGLTIVLDTFGVKLAQAACVARTGGDEFSVLVPGLPARQATRVAEAVREFASRSLIIQGESLYLDASVGIAGAPEHGSGVDAILTHAAQALSFVKKRGGAGVAVFSKRVANWSRARLDLERDLRSALADGELQVHYQPKVDVRTGRVVAAEALLRWNHPERGNLMPESFVPFAEENGLIVPIGAWVMRQACRHGAAWQRMTGREIGVAINFSPRQFQDPKLYDMVRDSISDSGIAPACVTVELTEGLLMQDAERAEQTLEALAGLGVRISVDDFGTGYSSLAYLKRFRVHELKIDRSFLTDVPNDENDAAIIHAIVALGRSLGLTVVAEGVRTPEQRLFLAGAGCDAYQGFLFSPAVAAREFAAFLRD